MSSQRAILASFVYKVPILRLDTFYAFSFEFIWSFFWTNASVFVITEHMTALTFYTFPGLSNPKVRRIAPYANIILCQIRSLNGTFAFSFFHIVNESLWTGFTLETDIVPEVWTVTGNAYFVLSVRPVRRTLTFFSQGVVNLFRWTYNTDHSGLVVM